MHIEHVEDGVVLERGEAQVLAFHLHDDRHHAWRGVRRKASSILGLRHPGEPLVLVIVLGCRLLDALREQIAQPHRVGGHEGTERVGLFLHQLTNSSSTHRSLTAPPSSKGRGENAPHRAISQVRDDLAGPGVLRVLERDAHGRELDANAVAFLEVLGTARARGGRQPGFPPCCHRR